MLPRTVERRAKSLPAKAPEIMRASAWAIAEKSSLLHRAVPENRSPFTNHMQASQKTPVRQECVIDTCAGISEHGPENPNPTEI